MITDEMIERVARSIEVKSGYVISQHHARALSRAALEAAYPLIAAKVLEEAVQIANGRAAIWARDRGQFKRGSCSLSLEEECEDIAEAIRALKAKYEESK